MATDWILSKSTLKPDTDFLISQTTMTLNEGQGQSHPTWYKNVEHSSLYHHTKSERNWSLHVWIQANVRIFFTKSHILSLEYWMDDTKWVWSSSCKQGSSLPESLPGMWLALLNHLTSTAYLRVCLQCGWACWITWLLQLTWEFASNVAGPAESPDFYSLPESLPGMWLALLHHLTSTAYLRVCLECGWPCCPHTLYVLQWLDVLRCQGRLLLQRLWADW